MIEVKNIFGKIYDKPEEEAIYNYNMLGINLAAQMVSYYSAPRKSVKWYEKVWF